MHRGSVPAAPGRRWSLFRLFTRLLFAWCAFSAHAASVWFSDAQGIHRIDTDTNVVSHHIAQGGVVALALNQRDGSLWATNGSTLFKYDAAGAALLTLDLKTLATSFNAATRLALDPSDDSIWVGGGRNLAHVDAAGRSIAVASVPSNVRDMALAQDQSLWVLGTNELAHYGASGVLLGSAGLTPQLQQAAMLAMDDANGSLWLAGARNLFQVAPTLPLQVRRAIPLSEVASGLTLVPENGEAWVAGQSTVVRYDRGGALLGTLELARTGIANFRALQFEPQSRSAWLAHEKGISRLDANGTLVATLPAAVAAVAISSAPSGIVPIVTLVSPADGTLTRNAFVPIRLHYDATCFGRPCNYPPGTFANYVLAATLNGRPIGSAFVFDPATGDAVYSPAARHDEGLNSLSAFVTDAEGRRSKVLTAQFTVDSIAPRFLSVTPADGSVFQTPGITLQGSIDDATGRVLLESFGGAVVSGPNPAGAGFAWGITLQPGANSFRLTATDPAGNANPLSLAYTYTTLTLQVTSPADGAVIEASKVTVTGTFSGAPTATITVNGLPATVSGTSFTRADVPLVFGANTLTVVGVTPQGVRATKTLVVTSAAPSVSISSPANGASVLADQVLVTGQVQAPAGASVMVNGVVAMVQGTTFYANGVRLALGANEIVATVRTRSGGEASATANVTSEGPAPVLVTAEPLDGIAPATVVFRLQNRAGLPINSFGYSPGGAGSSAAVPAGALFAFTYPASGIYQATLTLRDTAGNAYPQSFVIQVRTAEEMDAMFRALWKGMNDALVAGDKATAMSYLSRGAQRKFGPVFDALMADMPQIVASMSPLQRVALGPVLAEYAVNRTIDGTVRLFIVAFIQDDETGGWKIDQM